MMTRDAVLSRPPGGGTTAGESEGEATPVVDVFAYATERSGEGGFRSERLSTHRFRRVHLLFS